MLSWRRSDGPQWLIVVEASMGGTNYTFRLTYLGHEISQGEKLMASD
jgi:hypothetical protein